MPLMVRKLDLQGQGLPQGLGIVEKRNNQHLRILPIFYSNVNVEYAWKGYQTIFKGFITIRQFYHAWKQTKNCFACTKIWLL